MDDPFKRARFVERVVVNRPMFACNVVGGTNRTRFPRNRLRRMWSSSGARAFSLSDELLDDDVLDPIVTTRVPQRGSGRRKQREKSRPK